MDLSEKKKSISNKYQFISNCSTKQPKINGKRNVIMVDEWEDKNGNKHEIPAFFAESCYGCDINLTEEQLKEMVFRNKKWYKSFTNFQKTNCTQSEQDSICLVSSEDPFDITAQTRWDVRYFASIVRNIFPPDLITITLSDGTKKKQYANKFHIRGLYYRLASIHACIPYSYSFTSKTKKTLSEKGTIFKDIIAYLTKINYKGKFYILENAKLNKRTWDRIQKLSRLARYSQLIPIEQIVDRRITEGVQSSANEYTINPKLEKINAELNINIKLKNEEIYIDAPLIFIYTEKSQFDFAFDELSKYYKIAYYVGSGHVSITAAKQIYDYIKNHTKFAIILTANDFDPWGVQITTALGRKLQYFSAQDNDENKPIIMVHHWLLTPEDIQQLELINKTTIRTQGVFERTVNFGKGNKAILKKTAELDALYLLIGTQHIPDFDYSYTKNIVDILKIKLEEIFRQNAFILQKNTSIYIENDNSFKFGTALISQEIYNKIKLQSISQIEQDILNEINKKSNKKYKNIQEYLNEIRKKFEEDPNVKKLKKAIEDTKTEQKPIKIDIDIEELRKKINYFPNRTSQIKITIPKIKIDDKKEPLFKKDEEERIKEWNETAITVKADTKGPFSYANTTKSILVQHKRDKDTGETLIKEWFPGLVKKKK